MASIGKLSKQNLELCCQNLENYTKPRKLCCLTQQSS